MSEYWSTLYSQLHVYFIPVLLSFLAGIATVIGGFITFIVKFYPRLIFSTISI